MRVLRATGKEVCEMDTAFANCADRSEHSGGYRVRGKSAGAWQFSARDPEASLPISRFTPKSAESRTARGTWSLGSPSIDKLGRYRNPRWGRVSASKRNHLPEQSSSNS